LISLSTQQLHNNAAVLNPHSTKQDDGNLISRDIFNDLKTLDSMTLFFKKYDFMRPNKVTELEHTSTVQRSINSRSTRL